MNFRINTIASVSAILLCLAGMPAQAQVGRTFVSAGAGDDGNAPNCTRAAPCRTFQVAHDNTLPLGEITVLDPGGYGAVTITKAISIVNDGVGEAGVLVSGGATAITVNAGPSDAVNLVGLTIKGIGFGGGTGIVFNSGGSLTVENCAIRGLTVVGNAPQGHGILFQPNGSSRLAVLKTIVADNQQDGILVQPAAAGTVRVNLKRVRLIRNRNGLSLIALSGITGATVSATVADSLAARNSDRGFEIFSGNPTQSPVSLMLIRSVAAHNGNGIIYDEANVRVGASTLFNNFNGVEGGVPTVGTYGDNNIDGNGNNGQQFLFSITKK